MRTLFYTVLVIIAIVVASNYLFEEPQFHNAFDKIEYANKTDNPYLAEKVCIEELRKDTLNMDLNYQYVINHYKIPKTTRAGKHNVKHRDDKTIQSYFESLVATGDSDKADIGSYGLGLCASVDNEYQKADEYFKQISNKERKYIHNSMGKVIEDSDLKSAIVHYKQEIALKGNMQGAVNNLFDLYLKTNRLSQLNQFVNQPEIIDYVNPSEFRRYYFVKSDFRKYVSSLFSNYVKMFDQVGFVAALIITLIWLLYLRAIDVFEREKWYNISIVFVLGCLFSFLAFPLYDYVNITQKFNLNGGIFNDLAYCIFGIGLNEEIVKLLPFLIFLSFSKSVNEPIDYVIYMCVSALGFSFIENTEYFQDGTYYIIHGRALSSVVTHMSLSAVVAYGFILSKYKTHYPIIASVAVSLFAASVAHGLYDYWIINEKVQAFSVFSFFVMIVLIQTFGTIRINALNNSPFFDDKKKIDDTRLSRYLFLALVSIMVIEYLIMAYFFGSKAAGRSLLKSVLFGSFLLIFIIANLSNMQLKEGVWEKIKIWDKEKKTKLKR